MFLKYVFESRQHLVKDEHVMCLICISLLTSPRLGNLDTLQYVLNLCAVPLVYSHYNFAGLESK